MSRAGVRILRINDQFGEAWLLDDPVAVRRGLGLSNDFQVPNIRDVKSPKETLEELRKESELPFDSILDVQRIVGHVDFTRYLHSDETGFKAFEKDVKHSLKSVAATCGDSGRCGDACRQTEEA